MDQQRICEMTKERVEERTRQWSIEKDLEHEMTQENHDIFCHIFFKSIYIDGKTHNRNDTPRFEGEA